MLVFLLSLLGGLAGMSGGSSDAKSVKVDVPNGTDPSTKTDKSDLVVAPPVKPEVVVVPPTEPEVVVAPPAEPEVVITPPAEPDVVVTPPAEPEVVVTPPTEPEVVITPPAEPEVVVAPPKEPDVVVAPKEDVSEPEEVTAEVSDEDETPVEVVTPTPPTGNDIENENESPSANLSESLQQTAVAGRVTTFDLDDDTITSVEIMNDPAYGNVTVNPDNTLTLVLSDTTDTHDFSFGVKTTHADGSTNTYDVELDITEGTQGGGWGIGNAYMLETDENDEIIVEHGENHQKIYVSGSEDALTLADIAALEDMDVGDVTQRFLMNHEDYGRDEDMALAEDAGLKLWSGLTEEGETPSSDWLLLERGYEYDDMHDALQNGTVGESEINPIYIGAYGEGDNPVITGDPVFTGLGTENVVIQGIDFTGGFTSLRSQNLLIDQTNFSHSEVNIQLGDGFTLRNSSIVDAVDEGAKGGDVWSPHGDRESGIYVSKTSGLLIENSYFDHNGWGDGYGFDGEGNLPQPPSTYSHNVYLQYNNLDVTFRDNISMRAASFGVQVRTGGLIEDNVFLDNNAGANFLNGKEVEGEDYKSGNYTLFTDNLVTSGGHRAAAEGQGGLTLGVSAATEKAVLLDNIVAHLADPNNPDELAEKPVGHPSVQYGKNTNEILYDDTIVYNWAGANAYANDNVKNLNIDGLDTDVLDQTTIQLFAAELLGKDDATIEDLANYLRAQANGELDDVVDADLIIDYFQTGFGISPDIRGDAETLRFVPNSLAEGVRWDNRLNWNTEDLPGAQDGDSVDLAGNWVHYGGTTTLEDLDFGDGGKLNVTHGFLEIKDHIAVGDKGAELNIDRAGQFFADGYTDQDLLTINVAGGRFANTDLFIGHADLNISDNAQAILATDGADYVVNEQSSISITGGDAKVGFDGDQGETSVLLMAEGSELSFIAEDGDIGQIREFYSGHYDGTSPNIQSGVNLGQADLILDLTDVAGGEAFEKTLIEVDEIIGNFGGITVVGLGVEQNAEITVDYETDTVILSLGEAGKGNGDVSLNLSGDENDAQQNLDLWAALTNGHGVYSEDLPESIPEEDDVEDF